MIKIYTAGGPDRSGKNLLYAFLVEADNGAEPYKEAGLSDSSNPLVGEYEGIFRGLSHVKIHHDLHAECQVFCTNIIALRLTPGSPAYSDPQDPELSTARANTGFLASTMKVSFIPLSGEENPASVLLKEIQNLSNKSDSQEAEL